MIKPNCPRCEVPLQRRMNHNVFQYFCPSCMGFSIFIAGLKNLLDPREVSKLWQSSEKAAVGDAPCSHCRNKMRAIAHVTDQKTVELDVCRYCHLVWLDTGEWHDLKKEAQPTQFPNQEYASALLELESGKDTKMSFER